MIENQVNLKKAILQKEVHHTLKKKEKEKKSLGFVCGSGS